MQVDFFCICGHLKEEHYTKDNYESYGNQCWGGSIDHGIYITNACQCPKYRPDNLGYLERKYENNYSGK